MIDAVVVGSGPNGLAAALTLARAGLEVSVIEGADRPGGGCRTAELTLPGFQHDVCSAVHPLLIASPFFRSSAAAARVALRWPEVEFAHPLPDGGAAAAVRSVPETAATLGADERAYRSLMAPLVDGSEALVRTVLAPLRSFPSHPLLMARFGAVGVLPASVVARRFDSEAAKALLSGVASHSMLSLRAPLSGAFGLLLGSLAHAVGWPVVEGGSGRIIEALVSELEERGGRVATGRWVRSLDELPAARAVLLDVSPDQVLGLCGDRLPPRRRRALQRFRYGPGVFKVDWALSGPVPWTAEACRRAGTVHVGGTFAEVAGAEGEVAAGRHPDRPFCLVTQPTLMDASRAPAGGHTLWAYCHVPGGSTVDMTARIEDQIERFAPGFRDLILQRATKNAAQTQEANPTYVGGDINGGLASLRQTVLRPAPQWNPYRMVRPDDGPGVYLCSASAPPGGGVHGMCGEWAAKTVLADLDVRGR